MPEDDASADDVPLGRPLPPEDRLWRHPTELGWAAERTVPEVNRRRAGGPSAMWSVALTSGLAGAALAIGVIALLFDLDGPTERVIERVPVEDELAELAKDTQDGVTAVAASVSPSVIRLDVTSSAESVTGSGVVVRSDGVIVTNAHAVADADAITVVLADGSGLAARVIGVDRLTDLAVVAVDDPAASSIDWVPAVLGSSADLEVGEPAVAIGSPLGLAGAPSVTAGVVSGLHRRVEASGVVLHDMIQTDAPIARGSSGGALCDGSGVVIGITTALASTSAGFEGLGFAVPIDVVRAVAEELIGQGTVRRSWFGIEGSDLRPTVASLPGINGIGGVEVLSVHGDSPAAGAGIEPGDVIVAIGGDRILSMSDLVVALRTHRPGDTVAVEVLRGASTMRIDITLAERP